MKESSIPENALTEECLRNFKNGSNLAYLSVVAHFSEPLRRFVVQFTPDENAASGIVQDCLNKLWLRHPVINGARDIETFLYTAARQRCFAHLELRKRQGGQS